MVESTNDAPFLWRLSPESTSGYCTVSMVVPCPPQAKVRDFTIETGVLSPPPEDGSSYEEVLEWNNDDLSLFLKLLHHRHRQAGQPDHGPVQGGDQVRVDLTDPEVIDIIHVVAAAGFGLALSPEDVLRPNSEGMPVQECVIGSFATLNTVCGFKSCVVVDIRKNDVECVLLEDVHPPDDGDGHGEAVRLSRMDLVIVKRANLLHSALSESHPRPPDSQLH